MKEDDFIKKMKEHNIDISKVYYYIDEEDNDNIVLDEDSMREEYEANVKLVSDIAEGKIQ